MGKWQGTAPLSNSGDWTHGPILHLKYNNHSWKRAKISEADAARIGEAYALSLEMLNAATKHAYDAVYGRFAELGPDDDPGYLRQIFRAYFGDPGERVDPDFDVVYHTLLLTQKGLRGTSQENRVYIYTSASKPKFNNAAGYNVAYGGQAKPGRGMIEHHDPDKDHPGNIITTRATTGHIHLKIPAKGGLTESTHTMALTILHEATHRFVGTGDFAYHWEAKFFGLSSAEKVNNADSYTYFCFKVW